MLKFDWGFNPKDVNPETFSTDLKAFLALGEAGMGIDPFRQDLTDEEKRQVLERTKEEPVYFLAWIYYHNRDKQEALLKEWTAYLEKQYPYFWLPIGPSN